MTHPPARPIGCADQRPRHAECRVRRATQPDRRPMGQGPTPDRAAADGRYVDESAAQPWPDRERSICLEHPPRPAAPIAPKPGHRPPPAADQARPVRPAARPSAPAARPGRRGRPGASPPCRMQPIAHAAPATTADNRRPVASAQPARCAEWPRRGKYAGCPGGSCRCSGQSAVPAPDRHQSPPARHRWSNWFRRCWSPAPPCAGPVVTARWQRAGR